jgi:type I restriction enzyme R subunit
LGLAYHLQKALAAYTETGHPADTAIDQNVAVAQMMERYEICLGLFHGFDWSKWTKGSPKERLGLLPLALEHILAQDAKTRLLKAVRELSLAFALAVPDERALAVRDDVSFFQAVRAALVKSTVEGERSAEDVDHAIRQILSRAVTTDKVIDIFAAAGLKKPEISILSEAFLAEVKDLPQKNLAIELLRKLLNDELKGRLRKNLVQSRSFAEMLERTIRSYQNRTLESAQVIAELIKLAEEMREAEKRGEKLNLSEDEIAFYDALEVNDSAVKVLGDDTLKGIARELVETVRNNVTIDWTVKESVRAKLRVMVKRILRKHGYPPDKQERATQTVLEQAALIAKDWPE